MSREQIISEGLRKTKDIIAKMLEHNDSLDEKRNVNITRTLCLEVVCDRASDDDPFPVGTPLSLEVYAIKNGKDVDGVTIGSWASDNEMDDDITYLLNCYV